MPYQVRGSSCGATRETISWTRCASRRSPSGRPAISSSSFVRSRSRDFTPRPWAFSARISSARARIASFSAALKVPGVSSASLPMVVLLGSGSGRSVGGLLDADEVPGGVTHGAVADPVVLVDGLLDDLGPGGLERGVGRVEVGRG